MFKTLIIISVILLGYLIFRLPDIFPNTFTHHNPYDDDSDFPDDDTFS